MTVPTPRLFPGPDLTLLLEPISVRAPALVSKPVLDLISVSVPVHVYYLAAVPASAPYYAPALTPITASLSVPIPVPVPVRALYSEFVLVPGL